MLATAKPDRGLVEMNPRNARAAASASRPALPKSSHLAERLNRYGYHPAEYQGAGCTGCGICYYVCPEPGGIRVFRRAAMNHAKQLTKGNEAIVKAAVLAGCRAFYGYPITPASEIAEAAALYLPQAGGVFLQAESEVAAINMLYGGAAAGVRAMTASSGPGICLMQEGFSYLAGAELPCVIADIMRAGPGLGNIAPEQSDYNQIVKGGGHGNYRTLVLAPGFGPGNGGPHHPGLRPRGRVSQSVGRARRWLHRTDDGARGVRSAAPRPPAPRLGGHRDRRDAPQLVSSIYLEPDALERHIRKLEAKYQQAEREEVRAECWRTDDAEIILVGYGIVGRILKAVVELARARGMRVGLLRPITLYPFPIAQIRELAAAPGRSPWWK